MDLGEMWEGVAWMHPAQDRDQRLVSVKAVMSLRVPQKAENFLIS
jgi:hypothetical protein